MKISTILRYALYVLMIILGAWLFDLSETQEEPENNLSTSEQMPEETKSPDPEPKDERNIIFTWINEDTFKYYGEKIVFFSVTGLLMYTILKLLPSEEHQNLQNQTIILRNNAAVLLHHLRILMQNMPAEAIPGVLANHAVEFAYTREYLDALISNNHAMTPTQIVHLLDSYFFTGPETERWCQILEQSPIILTQLRDWCETLQVLAIDLSEDDLSIIANLRLKFNEILENDIQE